MYRSKILTTAGISTIAIALAVTPLAFGGDDADSKTMSDQKTEHRSEKAEMATSKHADKDGDERKVESIRGQIVNLHMFLTHAEAPAYDEAEDTQKSTAEKIVGTLASETPIGLWEKQEGIDKLVPGRPVYLVVFGHDNDTQRSAYKDARDLVGKDVTLHGRVFERAGLKGIVIEKVTENTLAKADTTDDATN